MKQNTKVRITKCYLIEICDKEGKELISDFCFGNYHDTKLQAEKMKKRIPIVEAIPKADYEKPL